MRKVIDGLVFIFLLFVLPVSLQASGKEYKCGKILPDELTLDGVLDEVFWKRAPKIKMNAMATGKETDFPNAVSIVHDDKNLYLGYHFENPVIWGKAKKRDEPFFAYSGGKSEMFVKLFLDPDGNGIDVLELHINPLGTIFDTIQRIPNINFNGVRFYRANGLCREDINIKGIEAAAKVYGTLNQDNDFDNAWSVEVKIPFESLKDFSTSGLPPLNTKKWRFSVQSRYFKHPLPSKAYYLSFPTMGIVDSHNYDVYADLIFSSKAPCSLDHKAVWCWSLPHKTKKDIEKAVLAAKKLGFNVIIWSGGKNWYDLIYYARKHGLKAYAPLVVSGSYFQEMTPEESKLKMADKTDYQRGGEPHGKEVLYTKRPEFLHPFVRQENKKRINKLIDRGFAGIAFDFIGYQNYYGSFSPLARRCLMESINPSIPEQKARDHFFEQTLVDFYRDMYDHAKKYAAAKARKIDISCHIYPVFLPNPLYGNKCKVDYCGQTVSWFFKPYW
ncbi:MAG: carbohydrate-binding family 9-like protein, partial [Victivallales bacterium]